jgi:hypothetical protein
MLSTVTIVLNFSTEFWMWLGWAVVFNIALVWIGNRIVIEAAKSDGYGMFLWFSAGITMLTLWIVFLFEAIRELV